MTNVNGAFWTAPFQQSIIQVGDSASGIDPGMVAESMHDWLRWAVPENDGYVIEDCADDRSDKV